MDSNCLTQSMDEPEPAMTDQMVSSRKQQDGIRATERRSHDASRTYFPL